MRRSFVTVMRTSCTLALALLPAAVFAQTPPAQTAPAAQPEKPKEPRLAFTGDAGIFLYTIKADQTAAFEELVSKVKESLAKSDKPERKQQLAAWRLYKASEASPGGTLYVFVADPALKSAEYDLLMLLAEGLGANAGTPENQELFKKYVGAFASGVNRLNLTPVK